MPISSQTPVTRVERQVLNPIYQGFVQEVLPSDFGLNYNKLFPRQTFKSNGDGRGYWRKRLHMDSLRRLDDEMLLRRPGIPAEKIDRDLTLKGFSTRRRHLDAVIVDDEADLLTRMEGGIDDPNVTEVRWIRELMLLSKEFRAAAFLANNNNVGGNSTASAKYDVSTTNVLPDIVAARLAVRRQSGMMANCMALPWEVALQLTLNESVQKIRTTTKDRDMTEEGVSNLLKQAFGFDKVTIFTSVYSPSNRNVNGTYSIQPVWADDIFVYHEPTGGPNFNKISWAVEAVDTFYYGGLENGVYTFKNEDAETTMHRVKEDSDFVLLCPEVSFAIRDVLS